MGSNQNHSKPILCPVAEFNDDGEPLQPIWEIWARRIGAGNAPECLCYLRDAGNSVPCLLVLIYSCTNILLLLEFYYLFEVKALHGVAFVR